MYDHLSDEELEVLIDALETTLKHEGGLVDHKDDPGGLTNFGISKKAYPCLLYTSPSPRDS